MTLTPAPPWTDLCALLRFSIYLYGGLFCIALFNSAIRRFTAIRSSSTAANRHPLHEVSLLVRSIRFYRNGIITYYTHVSAVRMLFSAFVCIAYVCITYAGHISRPLSIFLKSVGTILSVYICSVVATTDRPIPVVTNIAYVVEVISLSSILFAKPSDWLNFSFLQAYGFMSSYFAVESVAEVIFNFKWSQFQRQIARRAVEFVVFIYVFACGLQLFESMGEPWESFTATTFELTLANSFYFTVVTLFTVGYGDFVPFTLLGRVWIIFIIVFGAYLIAHKIGQVIEVVSDLRGGRGNFVKPEGTDHCVICGNVKWEYLKSFVEEFYQDERNTDKKLVVICDHPNWTDDTWSKFFFKKPDFRENVVYLEGACNSREDLDRAQVKTALAVFVLCNQHNPDPYGEDSETLKRILTIRSYQPNIPIYAMCALRDSMLQITFALEHLDENEANNEGVSRRPSMDMLAEQRRANPFTVGRNPVQDFSDDDDDDDGLLVQTYDGSSDLKSEAICMQEVEMSLMAENVFCNGLSTLLGNLILRIDPINKPTDQPWTVEYKIGSECRFEYVRLPTELSDRKFKEIGTIMYDYGVVLTATKRFMEHKWRAITPDTMFKNNTVGLIITYHSVKFLDDIMGHIAQRVQRLFHDSDMEQSSQSVPSVDDEFSDTAPDVPRYRFAGSFLSGDFSIYEYSADDGNAQDTRGADMFSPPPSLPSHAWASNTQRNSDHQPGTVGEVSQQIDSVIASQSTETVPPSIIRQPNQPRDVHTKTQFEDEPPLTTQKAEPRSKSAPPPSRSASGRVLDEIDEELDDETPPSSTAVVGRAVAELEAEFNITTDDTLGPNPLQTSNTEARTRRQSMSPMRRDPGSAERHQLSDSEAEVDAEAKPSVLREKDMDQRKFDGRSDDTNLDLSRDRDRNQERGALKPARASAISSSLPRRKHHVNFASQPASDHRSSGSKRNTGRYGESPNIDGDATATGSRRPRRDSNVSYPRTFFGDEELPIRLREHIVVCAIGEMSVMNLTYFLQRVWTKRESSEDDTPVVAVVPSITDDDETELSTKNKLFIIQGNSLSVNTLRSAQFNTAKAIIILACEDKTQVEEMDAKAMFTVMTLDYLLGESSQTFVCTMLDAEESMQLLRAPTHPRRKGVSLGPLMEGSLPQLPGRSRGRRRDMMEQSVGSNSHVRFREQDASGSVGVSNSQLRRTDSATTRSSFGQGMSFGALSALGTLPRTMSFVGTRLNTYTNRRQSIANIVIRDPHHLSVGRSPSRNQSSSFMSFGNLGGGGMGSDDRLSTVRGRSQMSGTVGNRIERSMSQMSRLTTGLGLEPSNYSLGADEGRQPGYWLDDELGINSGFLNNGPGASTHVGGNDDTPNQYARHRDESFEKQRYASGEMMISSTFMTLLIREYAMPGLASIVRKIFGVGFGQHAKSKRSWIRTVSIPKEWIDSAGKKKRNYREVFDHLLHNGAIAIGLYRAGDCNVRIQVERDDDDLGDLGESSTPEHNDGVDNDDYVSDTQGQSDDGGMSIPSSTSSRGRRQQGPFSEFVGGRRVHQSRHFELGEAGSSGEQSTSSNSLRRDLGDVVVDEAETASLVGAERSRRLSAGYSATDAASVEIQDGLGRPSSQRAARSREGKHDEGGKPMKERVPITTNLVHHLQHEIDVRNQAQPGRVDDDEDDDDVDDGEIEIHEEDDDVDVEEDDDGVGVNVTVDADDDEFEYDDLQKYTCQHTGRQAYYQEVPGGGNVLPYVYANPEPYTLVSHLDAVYVLVAPDVTLPTKW